MAQKHEIDDIIPFRYIQIPAHKTAIHIVLTYSDKRSMCMYISYEWLHMGR